MNLDPNIIEFPLFTATLSEKGEWIYKSKDLTLKKNGTLKAQYRELPRVKAIYEIESSIKNDFQQSLQQSMREINDKLIQFSK